MGRCESCYETSLVRSETFMPDLRSRIRDRKEHVTAPMATLGALRNPREVSLHPHGTQILGFWYRALVLAPTASCAHRPTMGRASRVAPFDTAAAQTSWGSDVCTS